VSNHVSDNVKIRNAGDLQNKLGQFQCYYNNKRAHSSLNKNTPAKTAFEPSEKVISMMHYRWKKHCRGLFKLPIAA